ncbi:hypothetical protein [Algoriphagus boritolerans]|uniref:Uncharacterized protein n=1 Tax=Algoriphagus boritolerans DSM 17298 = JCM 18970 TaxID=1120964 RepID=A0A1H5Y0K0_9BACT|nr:hypothetical protein [Algoriphagus boritolerans]SEG17140.1 hypothetical protein SAMN03080598_02741 [Algoriphagus boritolerans DSM 17298 = JCM 18970]
METNFNDIQQLWQSQKAENFDLASLIEGLKKTEVKQKRERIAIAIITPATLVFLFIFMPWQESKAILLSLLVIAVAMIGVGILSFSSRISPSDDSENFSNKEYLKSQFEKLKFRYKIAGKYMYYYAFLLAVALNVAYFVLLAPFSDLIRILTHTGLTVMIFGIMHFSIKRRLKKYDKSLQPMMKQLEKLLTEAKN